MNILCLSENHVKEPFQSEHGLSLLLTWEGHSLLFDMGASSLFLENAARLAQTWPGGSGCALARHYDHGRRPAGVPRRHNAHAPVYVRPRPSARAGRCGPRERWRQIGPGRVAARGPRLRLLTDNAQILPGALLFADEGREAPLPRANGVLFREEGGGWAPDPFCDEQNLLLRAEGKAVLVTGCAHRGIVNIVRRAQELAGGRIDAVVGGFHLSNPRTGVCEPEETLREVFRCFAELEGARFYTGTARATRPLRGCRRPSPGASFLCTPACAWSCRAQKKRAPAANAGARLRILTLRASSSP